MIVMPPMAYAMAGGIVITCACSGWIGYVTGAANAYKEGRESGIASANAACEAEKRLISATSHNEAARVLKENNDKIAALNLAEVARAEEVRVALLAIKASSLRDYNAAAERVRVAVEAAREARRGLPDGARGVSGVPGATPGGPLGSGGAWVLSERGPTDTLRLGQRAELVNAQLIACRAAAPQRNQRTNKVIP